MRIFITGGTGYVGRAVTRALAAAGHEVLGLVRTPERGDLLARLGGVPLLGDLCSPTGYAAAAGCDAVVYMAAPYGPDRQKVERAALEQLLSALRTRGGPRSLLYTSVLFVLGHVGTEPATEESPVRPVTPLDGRPEHESLVLEAAGANLSTAVVRPGMVYGGGAGGAVSELFRSAVEEGAAVYVGSGQNRWSLVHRDDVAALYRLILETGARGV